MNSPAEKFHEMTGFLKLSSFPPPDELSRSEQYSPHAPNRTGRNIASHPSEMASAIGEDYCGDGVRMNVNNKHSPAAGAGPLGMSILAIVDVIYYLL